MYGSEELAVFCFNDTATTEIYTLSLHDALPISIDVPLPRAEMMRSSPAKAPPQMNRMLVVSTCRNSCCGCLRPPDRKSTRLNSSHANISYAVFCLKKKKSTHPPPLPSNHPPTGF